MFSFAQKMVILFQNSLFGEIQFSQKSLTNRKKQPFTLSRQVLVQQTPIMSCCYYKPPHCRNNVPEKETEILEKGARGDRGSPKQNKSPRPDLSNALEFVSLVHVVVEILILKICYSNFLKICKNAQVN